MPYLSVALLTNAHAGTYIDVYGRLPITTGLVSIAEFTVDNGTPFISKYPSLTDISYNAATETASNYRMYYNPYLSAGIHTLVITPQAPNALWLDYAIAGTGPDLINSGDSISNFPSSTISGTPSPSQSDSSLSSSGHGTHTAKIVGGIAGAICLILVILGIIYCVRKRRRQRNANSDVLAPRQFSPGLRGSTHSWSR